MERNEILSRIDSSWQELNNTLEGIPADRLETVEIADDWSVKELMGHIAFWENVLAHGLKGIEPDPELVRLSLDEVNHLRHQVDAVRSLEEIQAEYEHTHKILIDLIHAEGTLDPEVLKNDTWEHYENHAASVRSWRNQEDI